MVIGLYIIEMFLIIKLYAYNYKFLPVNAVNWNDILKEDAFIFGGIFATIVGIGLSIWAVIIWRGTGFADLIPEITMRIAIPAVSLLMAGVHAIFSGFIMGILKIGSR
jgi:hypothetical protein